MQGAIEASLKNEAQRALARLQDTIIESLVEVEPAVVLHGGTAIWRCYGGNRFSEAVDIYATDAQMRNILNRFTWSLRSRGAAMDYPKPSARLLHISNTETHSKLEAMEFTQKTIPVQMEYVRVDASRIFVNTLSIRDFISEKVRTYEKRRYVRDLYDLYHLATVQKPSTKSKRLLSALLDNMEEPIDEGKLKDLVYAGIAPSLDAMVAGIRKAIS